MLPQIVQTICVNKQPAAIHHWYYKGRGIAGLTLEKRGDFYLNCRDTDKRRSFGELIVTIC